MEAMEQIQKMDPKKLVLISTVDVYKEPVGINYQEAMINTRMVHGYAGK